MGKTEKGETIYRQLPFIRGLETSTFGCLVPDYYEVVL